MSGRGPPASRYNERNEYTDYGKSRRKNFYSPNTASRRDYKSGGNSGGPGSSSLSHSKLNNNNNNSSSNDGSIPSSSSSMGHSVGSNSLSRSGYNAGTGPNVRDSRNYGGSQSYGSYYGTYGYNNNFQGGSGTNPNSNPNNPNNTSSNNNNDFYNSSWRSDRTKSGDSRLSSSNKPTLSTYNARMFSNNNNPNDNRKEKYDHPYSQSEASANSLSGGNLKWKSNASSYNSNKVPIASNRSSLSGSAGSRFSAKDRIRGPSFSGSSALVNSGSGTVASANNTSLGPVGAGKRGDTYYPGSGPRNPYSPVTYASSSTYGSPISSAVKPTDRFPNKASDRDYTKPRSVSGSGSAVTYDEEDTISELRDRDRDSDSTENEKSLGLKKESSDDYSPSPGIYDTPTTSNEKQETEKAMEFNEIERKDELLMKKSTDSREESDEIDVDEEQDDDEVADDEVQDFDKTKEQDDIDAERENETKSPLVETKVDNISPNKAEVKQEVTKIDVSNEICYPEGCTYPLTRIESEYRDLELEFTKEVNSDKSSEILKYSLVEPVSDFNDYPFFSRTFAKFIKQRPSLVNSLKTRNKALRRKQLTLWNEYTKGMGRWELERLKMDQQLRLLHPADDEMRREIDSSDNKKQNQPQFHNDIPRTGGSTSGSGNVSTTNVSTEAVAASVSQPGNRRGRRHGDLVTTEAEFQEILKSLGQEQDEDPIVKAERVAAKIPPLILDPVLRNDVKFMDANNIVQDKEEWAKRVKTDFINNFSPREHELFCEGFCLFPKRFGAISRHMGSLRSASDCVIHYYITKKAVNYKQLLVQHKKRATKKAGRRGRQPRSRNVSQTQTPVTTPGTEVANILTDVALEAKTGVLPNALPSEPFTEELFTETGRRKRAAAPVFEGKQKKPDSSSSTSTVSVTTVNNGSSNIISEDGKKIDSDTDTPPKKKARRRKEEITEASATGVFQVQSNGSVDQQKLDESERVDSSEKNTNDGQQQNESGVEGDNKERRRTISSYWSITEATMFPHLLKEHGTKWTTIADKLTTKTATMVRNYFQRNSEKNGWNKLAEEADQRLEAKFAAVLNPKEGGSAESSPQVTEQEEQQSQQHQQPQQPQQSQQPQQQQQQQQQQQPQVRTEHQHQVEQQRHIQQPPPIVAAVQPAPIVGQYIPMGTFQHAPVLGETQLPRVVHKPHVGPSISSLLSADVPPVSVEQQPAPTQYQQRYQQPQFPYQQQQHQQQQHQQQQVYHAHQQIYPHGSQIKTEHRYPQDAVVSLPPVRATPVSAPHKASIMSLLNSDSSPVKPEPVARSILHVNAPRKNSLHDLLNSPSSEPSFKPPVAPTKRNGIASLLSADPTPYGSSNGNGNNDQSTN
ncbi:DNA-binding protein SNT1 [Scheffersomyces xylosifermentans]|uniref:DNA-binding protein SNT1 n=1 Tax=Scheffersomyces xylosifermentans TaxID=1304137 RepID=UPI00315DF587